MYAPKTTDFQGCQKTVAEIFAGVRPSPGIASGLVGGMRIKTRTGWRPVEALEVGDLVETRDGGARPIRGIRRVSYGAEIAQVFPDGVIFVPRGALGNCTEFYALPEQRLLIDGAAVGVTALRPAALIRAADLDGLNGIMRLLPVDGIDVVSLFFDRDEVIFANSGVMAHCPAVRPRRAARTTAVVPAYHSLDGDAALRRVDALAGRPARATAFRNAA